jgi:hypothetical protein
MFLRKSYQAQKGTTRDFFRICERLIKDGLLHFKCMHSKSASFAFLYANMQNGFSLFMQSKRSFEVISWCSGCLSGFLSVRISLEFSELFF